MPFAETVEANLNPSALGRALVEAFTLKDVAKIQSLLEQGAPPHYRLDYGLEIYHEADFVAAFFLLMQGDLGFTTLKKNCIKILGEDKGSSVANYLKDALEIFNILHNKNHNHSKQQINPEFVKYLKQHAIDIRANPEHQNGSLIIAAGLRDPADVTQIICLGKNNSSEVLPEKNGAHVHFRGYFGDTATVWSAILLDKASLRILLTEGSEIHDLDISGSSLLHWIAVAARLDDSEERKIKALACASMLTDEYGASWEAINKLDIAAEDYSRKTSSGIQ